MTEGIPCELIYDTCACTTIRIVLPGSRIDPLCGPPPAPRSAARARVADDVSRYRSGHDHDDGCVFAGGEPVAEGTGESVQRLG